MEQELTSSRLMQWLRRRKHSCLLIRPSPSGIVAVNSKQASLRSLSTNCARQNQRWRRIAKNGRPLLNHCLSKT